MYWKLSVSRACGWKSMVRRSESVTMVKGDSHPGRCLEPSLAKSKTGRDPSMLPFDNYPGKGRALFGNSRGDNCRRGYDFKLQQITGARTCAYCNLDLTDTYEHWLLMTVDHVVPTKTGEELRIFSKLPDDFSNTILCCSGCNSFDNRFELPAGVKPPETLDEFFDLRDEIFKIRDRRIKEKVTTKKNSPM